MSEQNSKSDQRASNKSPGLECRTLTVEQAAQILGISRAGAYARAEDGSIPTIRMGKRLLVPKAAIEKMLAEFESAPA